MEKASIYCVVVLVAIVLSIFNLLTLAVIILDRYQRRLLSNYSVISFLLASLIQGMFSAPIYIFVELRGNNEMDANLCDFYRFSFFLSHYIGRISLMILSVDRLLAIKFPFIYDCYSTKKRTCALIISAWLLTIAVILIPLLDKNKDTNPDVHYLCHSPLRMEWQISVIVFYNIIPFIIMFLNYLSIWLVAAKAVMADRSRKRSVGREQIRLDLELRSCTLEATMVAFPTMSALTTPQPAAPPVDQNSLNLPLGHASWCMTRSTRKHSAVAVEHGNTRKVNRKFSFTRPIASPGIRRSLSFRKEKLKVFIELKATRVSIVLLAVYALCWGPHGIFYMIDCFCNNCLIEKPNLKATRIIIEHLAFSSSILAPAVHCWWNRDYRKALRRIFRKHYFQRETENMCMSRLYNL